jgi:sodium-dependent dicarboxylate transporter 2/3/5
VMTPVGTAPNQVYLGFAADLFPERDELSFAQWMLIWLPLLALYLPLGWWLLTRVVLRVESRSTAGAEAIGERRRALGPTTAPEWRMGLLFGATVLLWITRADLELGAFTVPGWQDVWERWTGAGSLSNSTVAVAAAVLAFVVPAGCRVRRGAKLMDWDTAKGLPWEVLLLLGGGFCLAAGVRESGLDEVLGAAFGPALDGLPPWLAVLGVVAAVTFLTEITSNTATTQVLLPVLFSAAVAAGVAPERWMLPATAAASCAFMLPVATPPNAVVYSSGRVSIPRMAGVGFGMNLLLIALITLVFELWGQRWLG